MSRRLHSSDAAALLAAERDIRAKLSGRQFDFTAMSAIANIYRGGTAVRTHMERTVLAEYSLSWAAFTVLWVLWIWGEAETSHIAAEAGITKGTLTGVVRTLQRRKLVRRRTHVDDRRRVSLSLTKAGERLIDALFPAFHRHERLALAPLSSDERAELSRLLRKLIAGLADDR